MQSALYKAVKAYRNNKKTVDKYLKVMFND